MKSTAYTTGMHTQSSVPCDETQITDRQFFESLDFTLPELAGVKNAWEKGRLSEAKKALVSYFETRQNVTYFYDHRALPLQKMEPDRLPYAYQSSLGLRGSLKEFCLKSGRSMMAHRYLLPGDRMEIDLGPSFESMIHFNFLEDQGKRHRSSLDMFVRGQFLEALCVLYHEEGDRQVLSSFTEILKKFFETYPLVVSDPSPGANRFQYTEDRDVMSVGWLTTVYISLFYTRIPYEIDTDIAFELLKHLWFLGIQFKRFETDGYRPYNHHMWERGLVPFLLSILLPEIPEFRAFRERGAAVICRHIHEDFNEDGGYSEHSIAYWAGAAIGEMLFRGIYLAKLSGIPLLDEEAHRKIFSTFSLLALLTPPGPRYPSLGDNGGPLVNPILDIGWNMLGHPMCGELLGAGRRELPGARCKELPGARHKELPGARRKELPGARHKELPGARHRTVETWDSGAYPAGGEPGTGGPPGLPLDLCSQKAGFLCGRSTYGPGGNYLLMSVKTNCGCSGHNHMDMLSLFLTFRGQEFIGEPCTDRLYHSVRMNSPLRGCMYNMTSHNTVLAHGLPVLPDSVYANKWGVYRPDSPVTGYWSEPDGMYAEAHHDAYTYCRHTRRLLFHRRKGLVIRDEIERGTRLSKPHIQRWHLDFGVSCRLLERGVQTDMPGESGMGAGIGSSAGTQAFAALLEKNGVSLLLVWSGCQGIRIWKDTSLCPEMYASEALLPLILDVSFFSAASQEVSPSPPRTADGTAENGAAALSLLILDITNQPELTVLRAGETNETIHNLENRLNALIPVMNDRRTIAKLEDIL